MKKKLNKSKNKNMIETKNNSVSRRDNEGGVKKSKDTSKKKM